MGEEWGTELRILVDEGSDFDDFGEIFPSIFLVLRHFRTFLLRDVVGFLSAKTVTVRYVFGRIDLSADAVKL